MVNKCKRLTHVFSDSMIASLVQLNFLNIESCEELEQIIARDNDDGKDQILPGDHLQSLCFPNLCEIDVRKCNMLKSLFPVAMASGWECFTCQCWEGDGAPESAGAVARTIIKYCMFQSRMLWFLIPSFREVRGVWMPKADHKICYYTKWFNKSSIRGAAELS